MDIAEMIGRKLKKVQDDYNYSQEELGKIINVTRQTISKYINGEQVIDSGKLYKISKHFNLSLDYFLSEPIDEDKISFMFRADDPEKSFDKELRKKISQKFNYYHEIISISDIQVKDYIPEEYNLDIKGDKLSDIEKETIAKIAEKQRRYMGVDDAININVFNIFEENNINIVSEEIEDANLDALSAYSKDQGSFIFLNDSKDIPEERKIFSVVHELGHLILHRDEYKKNPSQLEYTNSRIKDVREKVADYFAMSFLIPGKVLNNYSYYFDGFVDLDIILEKKKDFGISAKCLILALLENNFIDNRTLGALFKLLRENGYENKEPNPREYIKKNEKLYALVRKLLIQERITVNKAAIVLNIPIMEMRKQAKRWKNLGYNKT